MQILTRAFRAAPRLPLSRTLATTIPRRAPKGPQTPADPKEPKEDTADTALDPAARGVSEMRRQWGGLIDKADKPAEELAAAEAESGAVEIDLDAHEGLEAEPESGVDPAARGVSEMRRQWGSLIDEKKKD